MRVLVVPDKFKGTLSAREAAAAMATGWRRTRPQDTIRRLPLSDGGDGFGEVLGDLAGAHGRWVNTMDAAHRPCRARWGWVDPTHTALIESAEVIGLAQLPPNRHHPRELDTSGLATVLRAAAAMRPRRCIIGVGGSATNDGGFGFARALGWRFVARTGDDIDSWIDLSRVTRVVAPRRRLTLGRVTVAVDVLNPLLGARGCTRVYGPQKGLHSRDLKGAEAALRTLSRVMETETGKPLAGVGGAGAAGGLGFGLMAFLNARPVSGMSLFVREAELEGQLRAADLVLTGEGCFDRQSLMGKGVGELTALCRRFHVPCVVIAGCTRNVPRLPGGLIHVHSLDKITHPANALREPGRWLAVAAARVAAAWSRSPG